MINIPISIGELFDRISILEIKLEKIQNKEKLKNIKKELLLLNELSSTIAISRIQQLITQLKETNLILWDIEDKIRIKERNFEFDEEFIQLARNVYITNDNRSEIKRKINVITNSELIEEKSYE